MEVISREQFNELANYRGEHCISVYLPTHRAGVEVNEKQDALVFKNALQKINNDLQKKNIAPETINRILKPGFELHNNPLFWNNQLDGLAVFMADGYFKTIQLPFKVKEEQFLNHTFFLTPLIPAITSDEEFYVLVLSKHDAQFFEGNAFGMQRIMVEGLPNGMDDVVHFEEKDDLRLFRQGGKGGTGSASFHGHGEGQLDDKANIGLYFQEVDRTLFSEVLHDKNKPLLLAGVEYLMPIYKGISKYNFIVDDCICGNQEHENVNSLYAKAREKLVPYFQQRTNKALENYYNQIATSLTSSIPEDVIPASFYAQISDLFICRDEHIWGRFNEQDNKLEIHRGQQDGDDDLIDRAAIKTYLNGGGVYVLEKEKMPKEAVIAAFMRY
jgi:hypothetical protein